ncbi:hypothetical protein D3C78_1237770 [compost metagenome]
MQNCTDSAQAGKHAQVEAHRDQLLHRLGGLALLPGVHAMKQAVHDLRASHRQHDFIDPRHHEGGTVEGVHCNLQPGLQTANARLVILIAGRYGEYPRIGFQATHL